MTLSLRSKLILAVVLALSPLCGIHAGEDFATKLAKDCYVLKDDKLENIPTNSFQSTKLFIVYYSHIHCSVCPPVTKKLNDWREQIKDRKDISLVFATRGENNNKELVVYLKKSEIKFPALDTKYYVNSVNGTGEEHSFYADADEGVPRFRFFLPKGDEINLKDHGVTNVYQVLKPEQLEELSRKILTAPAKK